jgi:hypothetical protein
VARDSGNSKKTGGQSRLPEGNVTCVILDPTLFPGVPGIGVFIVLDFLKYPLSEYTLLDNYGAMYLVNDI